MRKRTEIASAVGYAAAALAFVATVGCREEPTDVQGAPAESPRSVAQQAPAEPPPAPPVQSLEVASPAPPVTAEPAPRAASRRRAATPVTPKSIITPAPLPSPSPAPVQMAPAPAPASPPPGASTDPRFAVWMQPSGSYRAGQAGSVEVMLSCKGEWHCNEQYPIKFTCDAPTAEVTYPQPVLRKDAITVTKERASVRVPVVLAGPGPAKVSGKLSFSVCTETQCVIETRAVATTVTVD